MFKFILCKHFIDYLARYYKYESTTFFAAICTACVHAGVDSCVNDGLVVTNFRRSSTPDVNLQQDAQMSVARARTLDINAQKHSQSLRPTRRSNSSISEAERNVASIGSNRVDLSGVMKLHRIQTPIYTGCNNGLGRLPEVAPIAYNFAVESTVHALPTFVRPNVSSTSLDENFSDSSLFEVAGSKFSSISNSVRSSAQSSEQVSPIQSSRKISIPSIFVDECDSEGGHSDSRNSLPSECPSLNESLVLSAQTVFLSPALEEQKPERVPLTLLNLDGGFDLRATTPHDSKRTKRIDEKQEQKNEEDACAKENKMKSLLLKGDASKQTTDNNDGAYA